MLRAVSVLVPGARSSADPSVTGGDDI
jgi:hypothetical protein